MSQMEIDRVLATIRSFSNSRAQRRRRAHRRRSASPARRRRQADPAPREFSNLLKQGIDSVNQTQQSAEHSPRAFEKGVPGVELPQVMLEMQKASVSFRALTEVRNRLVNAYQEIMNMPI